MNRWFKIGSILLLHGGNFLLNYHIFKSFPFRSSFYADWEEKEQEVKFVCSKVQKPKGYIFIFQIHPSDYVFMDKSLFTKLQRKLLHWKMYWGYVIIIPLNHNTLPRPLDIILVIFGGITNIKSCFHILFNHF